MLSDIQSCHYISEINMSQNLVKSEASHGSGRAIVIVYTADSVFDEQALKLFNSLQKNGTIYLLAISNFGLNWHKALAELIAFLEKNNIRNASFIAFEESTILLQALTLKRPKIVRSLVFIDPETRGQPSALAKWIKKTESFLPLGLPFRSEYEGFDGEPFLQRIRCPLFLVLASLKDDFKREQLITMSHRAPTSFFVELDIENKQEFDTNLTNYILQFFEIPAKSPQKNLVR